MGSAIAAVVMALVLLSTCAGVSYAAGLWAAIAGLAVFELVRTSRGEWHR